MAGDWMKIDLELPDKPEVHAIASNLNIDPNMVVGCLIRIWQWFDKHTTDGNAYGVTYSLLDRITGVTGFGKAMMFVGWIEQNDKTLTMPKFERHTSASAKTRALTYKRVAKTRNGESVTKALPEKRREEKNIKTKAKKSDDLVLPIWLDTSLWNAFKEMRIKIKKPMTKYAEKLVINDLQKMIDKGIDYRISLNNSIRNSWQDVYEPKLSNVVEVPDWKKDML
jgi:hypothetical protein